MKLGMCAVSGWNEGIELTRRLLFGGAVAQQLMMVCEDENPVRKSAAAERAWGSSRVSATALSLYCVFRQGGMSLWAIVEPTYYAGGIRDHDSVALNAEDRFSQIGRFVGNPWTVSQRQGSNRHQPFLLVQFSNSHRAARALISILMNQSRHPVRIMDLPGGDSLGLSYGHLPDLSDYQRCH
jgi:hypothetical protein